MKILFYHGDPDGDFTEVSQTIDSENSDNETLSFETGGLVNVENDGFATTVYTKEGHWYVTFDQEETSKFILESQGLLLGTKEEAAKRDAEYVLYAKHVLSCIENENQELFRIGMRIRVCINTTFIEDWSTIVTHDGEASSVGVAMYQEFARRIRLDPIRFAVGCIRADSNSRIDFPHDQVIYDGSS